MKEDRKVREMTKTVETVVSGDDVFKVDEQWKPWWTSFKFVSHSLFVRGIHQLIHRMTTHV